MLTEGDHERLQLLNTLQLDPLCHEEGTDLRRCRLASDHQIGSRARLLVSQVAGASLASAYFLQDFRHRHREPSFICKQIKSSSV